MTTPRGAQISYYVVNFVLTVVSWISWCGLIISVVSLISWCYYENQRRKYTNLTKAIKIDAIHKKCNILGVCNAITNDILYENCNAQGVCQDISIKNIQESVEDIHFNAYATGM